jgi:hypothetical protein
MNHVCPECRLAVRHQSVCPQCGRPMLALGGAGRVPKKTDRRGWASLIKQAFPKMTFPREKVAVVIAAGTYDDFKACVLTHVKRGCCEQKLPRGTKIGVRHSRGLHVRPSQGSRNGRGRALPQAWPHEDSRLYRKRRNRKVVRSALLPGMQGNGRSGRDGVRLPRADGSITMSIRKSAPAQAFR